MSLIVWFIMLGVMVVALILHNIDKNIILAAKAWEKWTREHEPKAPGDE